MDDRKIEANGSYTFYFERETVWEILMDIEAVAKALPGVQTMQPVEDEPLAWTANAQLDLAGKKATYSGVIRMSDIDELRGYRLLVKGITGGIDGEMQIRLEDCPEAGRTLIQWQAQAIFAEDIADSMRGVVQMAAMMLAQQFFMGLAKQLRSMRRNAV